MFFNKKIHNYSRQTSRRKDLRNTLTPAEAGLWKLLKNGQLQGRKFRRQHGIEGFIVDFYCAEEKLIIELDGEVHNDPMQMEYDKEREVRLEELGFTVLRFENKFVFIDTEGVLATITSAFTK